MKRIYQNLYRITKQNVIKTGIVTILSLTIILSGCSSPVTDESLIGEPESVSESEEPEYPGASEIISSLETAGYEVEQFETFEELNVEATRVKASKEEEYLDICFGTLSVDNSNAIAEYYMENYKQANLVNNDQAIFCYSSQTVLDDAGLWQ